MNTVLKSFLSMSFSGGLLILILLFGKRFLKDRISRQWQYYIWLVVVLRLLLPFGPPVSLLGDAYQAVDQAFAQNSPAPPQQSPMNNPGDVSDHAASMKQAKENADSPTDDLTASHPLQDITTLLIDHRWLVWLIIALGLLIRKITIYQSFIRYIKAGLNPVSDIEMLDRLSMTAQQTSVKKPVELCVNPLVSSPLLIGFFRPCIVLPCTDIPKKDFQYIVLHELTHYKRRDIFYKWLVQITVCLHWFNPLVYLMSREITRACEFSCDEAVLAKMGCGIAQDYGKTLLDAMAAVGKYKEKLGAVTLSENKQLLKERLGAIMKFKTPSKKVKILTAVLTLCIVIGASFVGIYTGGDVQAASPDTPPDTIDRPLQAKRQQNNGQEAASQIEQYYNADSVPLFQIAFSRLDEETQDKWLDRIYTDDRIAFWGAAVGLLEEDCALIRRYAEKTYADDSVSWFSVLAMHMSEDTLEAWLDKALEDQNPSFQSVLFNALEQDDESDKLREKLEKEWAAAQTAEYEAVGVTMDGMDYYYQGQLAGIFLDIRSNNSFCTLHTNPKGTVNLKIVRNEKNEITGVAYMTESEVTELMGDMEDPDNNTDPEIIPVDFKTVTAGEPVFLGDYTLSVGDRILYDVFAETGNRIRVFFAKDAPKKGQKDMVYYWAASILRQPGEPLKCTADFTVEPPAKSGIYKLYLQAPDDSLGNVKGHISIAPAAVP